jgi:hypothetical protein
MSLYLRMVGPEIATRDEPGDCDLGRYWPLLTACGAAVDETVLRLENRHSCLARASGKEDVPLDGTAAPLGA